MQVLSSVVLLVKFELGIRKNTCDICVHRKTGTTAKLCKNYKNVKKSAVLHSLSLNPTTAYNKIKQKDNKTTKHLQSSNLVDIFTDKHNILLWERPTQYTAQEFSYQFTILLVYLFYWKWSQCELYEDRCEQRAHVYNITCLVEANPRSTNCCWKKLYLKIVRKQKHQLYGTISYNTAEVYSSLKNDLAFQIYVAIFANLLIC